MNPAEEHSPRKRPRVTVCVVTYNHEKYIQDCLLSVLSQDPEIDTEILVGNDASTDATAEIVLRLSAQYPGRITSYVHQKNLGPSGNYQFLISQATAEFIAHLDGDDYWLPGKLRSQLAFFRAHPMAVAVYSNAVAIGFDKAPVGMFCGTHPKLIGTNYLLERGNFLCHSSLLYRSSARHVILDIAEPFIDYRMHLRLSRLGMLGFTNEVLVAYRVAVPNSMTAAAQAHVRQLYWQALLEACTSVKANQHARRGLMTFIGDELADSLRQMRMGRSAQYISSVHSTFPGITSIAIVCGGCFSTVSIFARAFARAIARKVFKATLRVLFPR